jgi:starvation-inducible DNA-binding protein
MSSVITVAPDQKTSVHATKCLQNVLADTYGVYFVTHNYHWNVEGRQFRDLHALFGSQYNELFNSIDVIAERIRALGAYALPIEGENLVNLLSTTSHALNKESDSSSRATRMVHNLISMNMAAIQTCQTAKENARSLNDDETENLLVERISAHQKSIWMLRSIVTL